jgi:sugar/nucleoside kinase (ribokinase family)
VKPTGLFVGLTTLDVVHYVERFPDADEKVEAAARWTGVGGPAANAAAAFAALGGQATLVTAIGSAGLAPFARDELATLGVEVVDLARGGELAVSSVLVDAEGRRTVASTNAQGFDQAGMPDRLPALAPPDVVVVDAHFPGVVFAACRRAAGSPVVLDPGGWKPQLAGLLPMSTHVIASRALDPGAGPEEILGRLERARPVVAAVTCGREPILASVGGVRFEVAVAPGEAIDTLGAGDVFHGAYAFSLALGRTPRESLEEAAAIATESCRVRGPRLSPHRR